MRLTCLLLFSFLIGFQAESYSQTANLSLNLPRTKLLNAFNEIEKQSDYYFYYNLNLDNYVVGPLVAENKDLKEVLDMLLNELGLTYEIIDRYVVIKRDENGSTGIVAKTSLPQKSISGRVADKTGTGLPGVTVIIKGTTLGTITDSNGDYSISNYPEQSILKFSFIGMVTQEIVVGNKTTLNITLDEYIFDIEEVVAIGYGIQKKKLVTGATFQIKGEELQKLNTVYLPTAMQSQSPGVSITKISGKPSSDFEINIRGLGTIGNASPLIIIDNVDGGDLNQLNPGDIESIDVLKDAATASIYGARAANGVILIKTKQGKKGKPGISYDGYYGIQNVAKQVDVLNAQQYIAMENEAYRNTGSAIPDWASLVPDYNRIQQGWTGTNWQKEFTNKNAPVQNHTLNMTGGSDYSTFSMGTSYTSQAGIYGQPVAPTYDRYSFRLNSEQILSKNASYDVIKVGENMLYNYIDQMHNGLATGNISWNDMRNVIGMHPLMSVVDDNGNFTKAIPWAESVNPIGSYSYIRSNTELQTYSLRVNPWVEIQPVKGLVFKCSFGYRLNSNEYRAYGPAYDLGGRSVQPLDKVTQSISSGFGFQFENTINYKFKMNNKHNFNALIGQSIEKNGFGSSVSGSNMGSMFNSFEYAWLNNVKTLNTSNLTINGTPLGRSSLNSFFGRINYDCNEKYLASLIMRSDGSSNFTKGKQWGYFPSAAVGWLVSEEPFMESSRKVLDYLKVRASWGQNGNQAIAPFQYMSTYSFTGADYYFGPGKSAPSVGAYPSILPNKEVTWETSEQLNIGFDAQFFRNRLGINLDWYTKTTRNWLVQAPVPATWGAAAPYINGGNIENKGLELVLFWKDKLGDLTYSISGNIAFNTNKVTRIANTEGIIEGGNTIFSTADRTSFYRAQVGYPIGYFYGYKTAGVFQNQSEIDAYAKAKLTGTKPGDLIYVDSNHDGLIDTRDKTMIGDPNPNAIYGLNFSLEYKDFDFSLSANGVAGNQIASNLRPAEKLYGNWPSVYLGRWHGEGTSNRYPRVDAATTSNWGWNSDIYVNNGDYLRIQNVTVGYNIKKIMSRIPFSRARVYIAANNIYTFTRYFGADPEVGYANESWSKGIDIGFYPSPRTFLLGFNLKF